VNKAFSEYDRLTLIERRISYLAGARLREMDKTRAAIERQDAIRRKHPATTGWDSVSEIRKWREVR
jgi:hypothetical protein